MRLSDAKQRE